MNSSRIYSSSKSYLVHADAAAADPVTWKGSRVSPELRSTAQRQKYKQEVVSVMMFICQSPALWGRSHLWQSAGPYLRPALPSVLHQIAMVITRPRSFLFLNLVSHSNLVKSPRDSFTTLYSGHGIHGQYSPGFELLTCFSCPSQSSGLLEYKLELHSLTRLPHPHSTALCLHLKLQINNQDLSTTASLFFCLQHFLVRDSPATSSRLAIGYSAFSLKLGKSYYCSVLCLHLDVTAF